MEPVDTESSGTLESPGNATRRSLLSLLGAGALAGGLAILVDPQLTAAKKKKKKKKKKNRQKKRKKRNKNTCDGRVHGSAAASEESALRDLINRFRSENGGLPPLARQSQLDSAAVAHSRDMATHCYFDHISPEGSAPDDRILAAGYQFSAWAENIYMGSGTYRSAAAAFDTWKNSPGHRANMLSADVTEIGIGTALDGSGAMIWTNVFGRPA
jgi:uncharacterized protein YkwD